MAAKEFLRNLFFGYKANSEKYIDYLRKKGVLIGQDVIFYAPTKTLVDEQYPWLISIGDHVRITQGVTILTHDYSWSVLKLAAGGPILGASGPVIIGNNVFIGMNTTIVRNVTIGNNVIIGAGSVVTKDCDDNCIYAGNPARKIGNVDDFYQKRRSAQIEEAKQLACGYFTRYGHKPSEEIFHEYFMLFENKRTAQGKNWCLEKLALGGNKEESLNYMELNPPQFLTFNDFLAYCFDDE